MRRGGFSCFLRCRLQFVVVRASKVPNIQAWAIQLLSNVQSHHTFSIQKFLSDFAVFHLYLFK